jgi:acetyltransferase
MELIIEYARSEKLEGIEGQVLSENTIMLRMCGELGFDIQHDPGDPTVMLARLSLRP